MSVFITFLVIEGVRLRVTKKVKYEDNNNNMEIKKDKRIVLNISEENKLPKKIDKAN